MKKSRFKMTRIPLITENEKAYNKILSKIESLKNDIKSKTFNIENNLVTPFIPVEKHKDVVEYKKRELKVYKYILNLINKDK